MGNQQQKIPLFIVVNHLMHVQGWVISLHPPSAAKTVKATVKSFGTHLVGSITNIFE